MSAAVSLCMIVKNEVSRLRQCFDAVKGLATEIVVVDTGSSDGTGEVAASYGARVFPFDFVRTDFAAARNHGLERASAPWILVLDADEVLDPGGLPVIRELVAAGENAGYYFERRNHPGRGQRRTRDYVVRLFPNRPDYRYRGRVHETIDRAILDGGGRLVRTAIRLDHDCALDREARRRKNFWYISVLNEELAANPTDDSRLDFLAAEYHQLGLFGEAAGIAERIATLRPFDPQAHLSAGIYHWLYQNNPCQGRLDFQQALRVCPGHADAELFLRLLEEQQREKGEKWP